MTEDRPEDEQLHDCGYVEDTFACKIRHQSILSGNSEAKKHDIEIRAKRQESVYGI